MVKAAKAAPVGVEAPAPAPKKAKTTPSWAPADGWTIEIHADGTLNHDDLEQLACLMADDLTGPEAWKALGKANDGSPGAKRRFAEKHPVFVARLAILRNERTTLENGDQIFGEVRWMAKQLWRSARAKNDIKAMSEAVKLMFDIGKHQADSGRAKLDPAASDEGEADKRGAGRPAKENPQSKRDPATMRALLLERGVTFKKPAENEEEGGEIGEEVEEGED